MKQLKNIAPHWTPTGSNQPFTFNVHTKLVREAASRRGVDIEQIYGSTFILKHNGKSILFSEHMPALTPFTSRSVSNDKHASKIFLERAEVNTPSGDTFPSQDIEKGLEYANRIGYPVVIKPLTGSGGSGVTSNIQDETHFRSAWESIKRPGRYIVEKHINGNDYRLLVVDGQFICAAQRIPVNVTGDGKSTINELIKKKNDDRSKNPYVGSKKINLDSEMIRKLKTQGLDEQSILPKNQQIQLLSVANIGTGGDSKDVTDKVHPDFIEIAIKAAKAIPDCFFVGVDLLAPDISSPASEQTYAVCEINTRCDIGLHHFPVFGPGRDAAGSLIEAIFPEAKPVTKNLMKKVKITLRGSVIGTGTRKSIFNLATLNHITGWVKNEDKEVKALLCGSESAVNRALLTLISRPSTLVSSEPWLGEVPNDFKII